MMDDTTFEEKVVFRLTPSLLFYSFVTIIVLFIILTISLVAFTPLREYIPGYGSEQNMKKMIQLKTQTDSLQKMIADITTYEQSVKTILANGNFKDDTVDFVPQTPVAEGKGTFAFSEYDSILIQTEISKAANLKKKTTHVKQKEYRRPSLFFTPVKGVVQQKYTTDLKGIKIACAKEASVFTPLSGTVIYVGCTLESGTCILILHPENIVTIYQNVGRPTVQTGDYVKPKQLIAVINSEIPLTFGLWINGGFVNPEEYIAF
jgi:murein DD-endopeptidase MepM/ murein hydrolase activator NlpD